MEESKPYSMAKNDAGMTRYVCKCGTSTAHSHSPTYAESLIRLHVQESCSLNKK